MDLSDAAPDRRGGTHEAPAVGGLLGLEERTVASSRYTRARRHVSRTAPPTVSGCPGWCGAPQGAGAAGLVMISVAVGLDFGLSNQSAPRARSGPPPGPVRPEDTPYRELRLLFALHHDRRRRRAGRARDLVRFERAVPFSRPHLPNDLRRRHRDPRVPNGATHHGRSLRHRRQLLLLDIPVADGGYGLAWRATNPAPGTAPSCASSSTGSPLGAWVRVE